MALQTSGPISLNDLHVEAGGSSGTTCTLNDADIRDIIGKASGATNSLFEYYGQSSEELLTSGGTINGQAQRQEITASTYISSGGTLRIPSTMWVWSDSRTTAALTIDIPCTIINDGKIIGKGGQGGSGLRIKNLAHPTTSAYNAGYHTSGLGTGTDGGPAIKINSNVSGVTITNSSGAYICGGGGGGGSSGVEPQNSFSGGGAGAGGAEGGCADLYSFNKMQERGKALADQVEKGVNLTDAMAETGLFPDAAIQLSRTGGDTGNYDIMLDKAADFLTADNARKVKSIMSLVEPAVILFAGCVIALIIFALISVTMSLNASFI